MDVLWLPYKTLNTDRVGFVSDVDKLPTLVRQLSNWTGDQVEQREAHISSLRESHPSPTGVLQQIVGFLQGSNRREGKQHPSMANTSIMPVNSELRPQCEVKPLSCPCVQCQIHAIHRGYFSTQVVTDIISFARTLVWPFFWNSIDGSFNGIDESLRASACIVEKADGIKAQQMRLCSFEKRIRDGI